MTLLWLAPSVIATIAGTVILASIYYFLYLQDRKDYLLIWAFGWSIYFGRFLFMLWMVIGQENSILLVGNQICSFISGIFLLWGTYKFIDKKFPVLWIYAAFFGSGWIIFSVFFELPFLFTSVPTFTFLAMVYIWTGLLFVRSNSTETKERTITGFAFIIWGIHKADYPFLRPVLWFAPWGYLLGAMLEIIVALGLLLIYFQKTRNELSKSEKNLSITLHSIGDAVITVDTEGEITNMNPVAEHLTGWTLEQAKGIALTQVFNIVNTKTKKPVTDPPQQVMKTGKTVGLANHTTLISKNGHEYQIADSAAPIQDSTGKILGVVLVFRDVTKEYRTRENLEESEKRYRFLSDASMEAIFFTRDGIGLEANQAAADMFGYKNPKEFIGKFGTEIIAPQSHGIVKEHMLKNLTDPYEAVGIKRDGTHFPIKIQSKTIRYKNNQLVRVTSIIDVSDLKLKEKELHESEEKFRILYDLSPQSIALTNIRTGKLVNVNKKFCALTGYSKNELTSSTVTELNFYSAPDRKKFLEQLQKTGEIQGLEMDFRAKDGSVLNALMFAKLIKIAGESLILTIFTDLTIFKKLESRLRQSQKMETIGTLAGGIAHDFNNILSPIVGHTEILLSDHTVEDSFRASLKQILSGAVRASELVKQILTFSSQTSDKLKPIQLEPVINEALKLIRATIPTTIEITQDLQNACSLVKADSTQVHQIIMNLTTNAYHAMKETGGEIRVHLKEVQLSKHDVFGPDVKPGIYACLSVADTGIGMDKDVSRKIFEPFFTTKKKGKGTGMGLSVVYGIVKSMGGSIQVYSEPAKGSEFKLYFPTEEEPFTEKENDPSEEIPKGTERILLIDDEEPIITMAKKMLELLGYHVTSRLNSLEALQLFRECPNNFDMVITDMAMPAMSGDKLSVELTKIRPDIPILLCTGFSETMTEEKAASIGISGFLLKPITMKEFSQKIREVLDKGVHQ